MIKKLKNWTSIAFILIVLFGGLLSPMFYTQHHSMMPYMHMTNMMF